MQPLPSAIYCGNPAYPGILVALTPGQQPVAARRINYFQSPKFEGCFDPHPDHPPPLTLAELALRDARRKAALPPPEQPKIVYEQPEEGFLSSLLRFLIVDHWEVALGGLAIVGLLIGYQLYSHRSITSGPAIVDNAPQLNLRSCAAANCGVVTVLNKGDQVTVTQSFDNGWKGVTVRYDNGMVARGFVNGDFLRRP